MATIQTLTYEQDFYGWLTASALLLRQGRFAEMDSEHIAEELEAMSKREKRELTRARKLSGMRGLRIHCPFDP